MSDTAEMIGAPVEGEQPSGFGAGGNQQAGIPPVPTNPNQSPAGNTDGYIRRPYAESVSGSKPEEGTQETEEASTEEPTGQQQEEVTPEEPKSVSLDDLEYSSVSDLMDTFKDDPLVKPMVQWLDNQLSVGEVDIKRAFHNVLKSGDIGYLDEGYLKEKLGDNAESAIEYAKSLWSFTQAKAEEQMNSLYNQYGGQEAVQKAAQYWKASASALDQSAIKQMLDSGNKDLIGYAMQQITSFAKSNGAVVQHRSPTLSGQVIQQQGLSSADFKAKIVTAKTEQERASLYEARRLGMTQGL